jgi:DNA-binding NtrC family response regulator
VSAPGAIHVLLVEPDGAAARSLASGLEASGCQVSVFPDYRGALALIESGEQLTVMVTSLQLPAGTPHGVALANMAAQKRPGLPVVFMSEDVASAQWVDERWGPVLFKPIDVDSLASAMKRAIEDR